MKKLFYLTNTLSYIEWCFDGFVSHMRDFFDEDTVDAVQRTIDLYDARISESIEHAKNLVKDIEEGEINET